MQPRWWQRFLVWRTVGEGEPEHRTLRARIGGSVLAVADGLELLAERGERVGRQRQPAAKGGAQRAAVADVREGRHVVALQVGDHLPHVGAQRARCARRGREEMHLLR